MAPEIGPVATALLIPEWMTPESCDGHLAGVMQTLASGYGDKYIGDTAFLGHTLPNTTDIAILFSGQKVAATAVLNTDRIIAFSVDPLFQGKGVGVQLLELVVAGKPGAWASIDVTALGMLNTFTSGRVDFRPLEDEREIATLFRAIKGVAQPQINLHPTDSPFLKRRLARRQGSINGRFTAFTREGSLHGSDYHQFVFQHKVT